ncbi:hypothetical protein SDC9_121540 [bioreactor metagenome]|uniref:Uncharacterized protein n=1 Tax=bioreactor metagenome TaxID=1076179 RepID=A0A645CCE6_9ZZZZ
MPEFLQVTFFETLCGFFTESHITALSADSRDFVLLFGLHRKVEKISYFAIKFINQLVIQKVTFQGNKADFFVSFSDFIYKFLLAFRVVRKEITQIHTRNLIHCICLKITGAKISKIYRSRNLDEMICIKQFTMIIEIVFTRFVASGNHP